MRSLFWRILASFWLAITLVAGLSILLGHMLNQDAWILSRHPGLNTLASKWAKHYEQEGLDSAQHFLERRKDRYKIDVQVLDDSGEAVVPGTFPRRAAAFEARQHNDQRRLPWRSKPCARRTGSSWRCRISRRRAGEPADRCQSNGSKWLH